MKKLLAILLALMLCVSALSVVAFAAETTTVHAYVPSDWSKPNVYGWTDPDGNPNWPGTAMTQEDGQWYVGTIDIVNNRVIINNDSGSPQTVDLSLDAGFEEIWVVVGAVGGEGKFEGTVYYSADEVQLPSGETGTPDDEPAEDVNAADPEGLFAVPNSLAIVGSAIPGVGEWNPGDPAGDMTEVSELVYEIDIACPAGTNMTFKFAGNDAWDDTCNLHSGTPAIGSTCDLVNGPGEGNMTLAVDKDVVLKFTVDLTALADGTGAATLTIAETEGTVEPGDEPTDEPTDGNITIYARIPESWGTSPCCWAWKMADNTNAFSAWPGEVMTQDGEWFVIQAPNWVTGVIINDGGSTQTADLTVEEGKDIWVDVYSFDNAVVTYSDPGERVEPTQPTQPETQPTQPTTKPTEAEKDEAETEGGMTEEELRAAKKTHTILIIVLVLVWVVVVAELITIFLKKKS
ncbi:MAG: starch-binding protein [Oscillospiraceae bacterium]|nr:starch-binding protein [Oscillospiraceae bacterium]